MQGRYDVVVLFAVLVVGGAAPLQHHGEACRVQGLGATNGEQRLRQGQHIAAIAVRHGEQRLARGGRNRKGMALEGFGPGEQRLQRRVVEPLQHIDLAAGEQRAVQLERGILRGGAD